MTQSSRLDGRSGGPAAWTRSALPGSSELTTMSEPTTVHSGASVESSVKTLPPVHVGPGTTRPKLPSPWTRIQS